MIIKPLPPFNKQLSRLWSRLRSRLKQAGPLNATNAVLFMLRNPKPRLVVVVLVLLLTGVLYFTREPSTTEPPGQITTPPPVTEDEDSGEDGQEPLTVPFYPTFEDIGILTERDALEAYVYTIDKTAYVYDEDLDVEAFLEMDFYTELINPLNNEPKILIFHTHASEAFIDSRPGEQADTIVGVGSELARILAETYGVSVVHDIGCYDQVNGVEFREGSYERMEPSVARLLDKYPSIEITIDLHRDGVPDDVRLLTVIDGQPVARVMFFNGISRLNQNGEPAELDYLPNPHVPQNLGLSFQLQLTANTLYPGFARRIYIRPYRYSLHFKPKSMLIEAGANTNTVSEAMNAMKPLAEVLMQVLGG